MADRAHRGLGRGLTALMADVATPTAPESPRLDRRIAVDRISPNPDQPRRSFQRAALEELAASIAERGVIQPLVLRLDPRDATRYQIVAGERRWRAAQMAHLHDVPAIIREFDDAEVLEIAIIENIQRADLNAVEEAAGYRQLMDRFGHTQEKLAEALGKSRSHIANTLRLLNLPDSVQRLVAEGTLSAGHARALITAPNADTLAREVVRRGLSVRQTERLSKAGGKKQGLTPPPTKDADTRSLEADLKAALGMAVTIDHHASGEGSVRIQYASLEQLDELCRRLTARDVAEAD